MPIRVAHPLLRKHPDTCAEAIYISCGNIDWMEVDADETSGEPAFNLDTAASYDLVHQLLGEVTYHIRQPATI